ncbi:hypothetical protein [Pseudomonas fluorescens]|uniref:hypothetical protein n=1 Tax=Pseudomonas fluorescens TaxID=294 RepID=UPI001BE6CC88|nr:hypothetical protein [Pseudomonas fluorescens]MBT2373902.1 hypothetical protein [Pseudomonas fluorescens]
MNLKPTFQKVLCITAMANALLVVQPAFALTLDLGPVGQVTLGELNGDGGKAWLDISIIPTGPMSGTGYPSSLAEAKLAAGGVIVEAFPSEKIPE